MKPSEKIDIQKATDYVLKGIRSDDTRKNLLIIINTILEEMKKNPDKCIQGNRLQELCIGEDKIPYLTTYYRLLKKLVESKIVHVIETKQKPKTKGKKPKFYAIPDGFNPLVLESREALLDRCIFLESRLKGCEGSYHDSEKRFKIACDILKEKGIDNPIELILDILHENDEN